MAVTTPTPAIQTLQKQQQELQRKIRILTTSRKLTHEFIGQAYGVKHLLQIVFERILTALDAEAGSLWIHDNASKKNICHLAEGPVKQQVIGLRLDLEVGIVGNVIATQKTKIILDCSKSKEFTQSVDQKTGFVTHSMICVPLIIDGQSYGAIQIVNKKNDSQRHFDMSDCELVKDLAISAAISMKNAKLLEMESKVQEMHALMTIANEVVSTLDIDQVLNFVVNRTNEIADIAFGAIALTDNNSDELSLAVLSGGAAIDPEDPKQQKMLPLMGQIGKLQRASYVADSQYYINSLQGKSNDWSDYLKTFNVSSLWSIALQDEEGLLGVLWFEGATERFANGGKSDLLHIMAAQATVALRNASLFKSITERHSLSGLKRSGLNWLQSRGKKLGLLATVLSGLVLTLHYAPVLRWVSAPTTVETQLGQGIFMPVSGQVKEILVTEGQPVKQGQVLVQMATEALQLDLLDAESQLAIVERQIIDARAKKDSFTLSSAMIQRDALIARVAKLQKDVQSAAILAPIDGIVLNTNVSELLGRQLGVGDELLRIANPERFRLVVHVAEEDVLDIAPEQSVRAVLRAKPGEYVRGKVIHVGRAYEVPTTVLGESNNVDTEELQTGFVAEVLITHSDYPVLPGMTGQALVYTPETSYVERQWRRLRNFFTFTLGL